MDRERALKDCRSMSFRVIAPAFLVMWSVAAVSHAQVSPTEIVKLSGVDHGLCVIIGCGDEKSPNLAAELAASEKFLVHGIALDDAALARASAAVSAAGVDGLATVEKLLDANFRLQGDGQVPSLQISS